MEDSERSSAFSADNDDNNNKVRASNCIEPCKSSPDLVKAQSKEELGTQANQSPDVQQPKISAQSFLIYDCNTGQVLLSRKGTQRREVASITKMMTFYTVLKLIERYHASLHSYGYNVANAAQELAEQS